MKILISIIIIGSLITSFAYGLDEETKDKLIDLYNCTRSNYILVDGLMDDFKASKVDETQAKAKLAEWKEKYSKDIEPIPQEAKKMCESMLAIFDAAKAALDDYQPQNLRTKTLLEALDKAYSTLMADMTSIKYLVK